MPVPHISLYQRRLTAAVAAVLGLTLASVEAGTYTWVSGNAGAWSTGANWTGGVAPGGNNPADVLIFGGTPAIATINDDISGTFLLNSLQFQTADGSGLQTLTASANNSLRFSGSNAQILQNGGGNFTLKLPISSTSNLEFGGSGVSNPQLTTSVVTLDGPISGVFDITKNGLNTFRFGSLSGTAPSGNTWIGTLTINDGAIRFNNNAYAGPTALRSNPVVLNGGSLSTQVTVDSSLRFGTLSGSGGTVSGTTGATNSVDLVITALQDGSFGGTISNIGGTNEGKLIVRGTGSQTFTGTTQLAKDVVVGRGATLTLAGAASLGSQASGSIILNGGTFRLDNSVVNNANRLRNGAIDSTGLDTVGGGTFSLIGNTAGTTEQIGRLQLGTATKPRSGALNINVTQPENATGATVLNIQSFSRDSTQQTYATVNFTSNSTLGAAGVSPRIVFNGTTPILRNGLLTGSNVGSADIGWATVNGSSFATHDTTLGIAPVSTVEFGVNDTNSASNIRLGGSGEISTTLPTSYARNSLKIEPSAAGQQLSISSTGHLQTGALLLAGNTDYSISNTGTGTGGWTSPSTRYAYVQSATLSLNVKLLGNGALVKSGAGTLALTANNAAFNQPVAINEGILRATPGTTGSLPGGEIRFRGGVLELQGDGVNTTTFTRQLGNGVSKVTWSGVDTTGASIDDDRGSGGFAAIGSDATVAITSTSLSTTLFWEDTGFLSSGHALTFGSRSADRMVTWTSNISLSEVIAAGNISNYNAREFRVIDNSTVATDRARISGSISGSANNDLLKTGDGVLELSGSNSFGGATIVQEGTLLVNGSSTSFLTDVRNGATLGGRGAVKAVRVGAGGTIAPGELAGVTGQTSTLTLNGDLSFAGPTSKLRFELAAGSYDQLDVKGGGVMLEGAELVGSLLNGFLATQGDLFFLIINDGTDAVQGTFVQGSSVQVGGQMFEISYTGNFDNLSFTGGNDVVLRAIPEPSSALLLGGGLAMLAARRRKRR